MGRGKGVKDGKTDLPEILSERMTRRKAVSTGTKMGVAAAVAALVAGAGGYFSGTSVSPQISEKTTTVTSTETTTVTSRGTTTVTSTGTPTTSALPTKLESPVTVRIGTLTHVIDTLPVNLPIQQGWFEDAGLHIEKVPGKSGAEVLQAAISGNVDVGNSAMLYTWSSILAGNPILYLASMASFDTDHQPEAYLVRKDLWDNGTFRSPRDLANKTVGVHVFGAELDLAARKLAEIFGIPQEAMNLVQVTYPNQGAAFASGKIDASHGAEPFITDIVEKNLAVLLPDPINGKQRFTPEFVLSRRYIARDFYPMNMFWVTKDFATKNPEAVRVLLGIVKKSIDFINANPDQAATIAAQITGLSADVVKRISWSKFGYDAPLTDVQKIVDGLYNDGIFKQRINVKDYLAPQSIIREV